MGDGMIHVTAGNASNTEFYRDESLAFVRMAISAGPGTSVGWDAESARLFAIDTALVVLRVNLARLAELDRQVIANSLNEARRLVVDGRDRELGHIQHRFESRLSHSWSADARSIWLTAINALLPSPFRAAETAVESAYRAGGTDPDKLAELLADRLRARVGEWSLLTNQRSILFASA